jgi:hypothetical protein
LLFTSLRINKKAGKKKPATQAGCCHPALAAFFKRPQAVAQIGAHLILGQHPAGVNVPAWTFRFQ